MEENQWEGLNPQWVVTPVKEKEEEGSKVSVTQQYHEFHHEHMTTVTYR
jgi:hypothetical protein